jgi:hypothetical protein
MTCCTLPVNGIRSLMMGSRRTWMADLTVPNHRVIALAMTGKARVYGSPRKGYSRSWGNWFSVQHMVAVRDTTAVAFPARGLRRSRKVCCGIH